MGKKDNKKELAKLVDELISEVGADRERLTSFLDKLISQYDNDQSVGIAEYVAKLVDALTRQHQVKASTIKVLAKNNATDEDEEGELSELSKEIGLPFQREDLDDGN